MIKKKKSFMLWIARLVDRLPLAIIAGLAGFSAVTMILLLLDQFKVELLWSLGVLGALICAGIVYRFAPASDRPGKWKEWLICDIAILLGVVTWGAFQIDYTSQHVLTNRDPATYAVTASWLASHDNLRISIPDSLIKVEGVSAWSAGFYADKERQQVFPQGQHLLPALLGATGKIVGEVRLLNLNLLFGMTALLAVYCFARLFMRSYWALLASGVMALSLPLIYFSRDTYTEPLTLTLTFGGLALLWMAMKNRIAWLWVVAGLTLGASLLARIDSYLVLICLAVFFTIYAVIGTTAERKQKFKHIVLFALPVAVMGVVAWLDLREFSNHYLEDVQSLLMMELAMLGAIVVLGVVANLIVTKWPGFLRWKDKVTKNWRAPAALLLVLVLGVVLVSRPLWFEGGNTRLNPLVAGLQEAEGMEVEPRNYAEITTYWVSWYIGPVLAVLGLVGIAYAAYRSMHDKSMLMLAALLVIGGVALLYFVRPSITPDQVWAARRMLPVVIPGVAIFGVYALSILFDKIRIRQKGLKASLIVFASAGLIIAPWTVSSPFMETPEMRQYTIVNTVCDTLPDNAVVVWIGLSRMEMVYPTRTYCDVESYSYQLNESDKPSRQMLAEIAREARERGKVPVLGLYRYQFGGLLDKNMYENLTVLPELKFTGIVPTLMSPPSRTEELIVQPSLGYIQNDGSLRPIPQN